VVHEGFYSVDGPSPEDVRGRVFSFPLGLLPI
jgi:hypothetical protein